MPSMFDLCYILQVTKSKCDLDQLMNSAEGMSNLPSLYERMNLMELRVRIYSNTKNIYLHKLNMCSMSSNQ